MSTNDAQQIIGFFIGEPTDVLVRAVGPSLGDLGVDATLANPSIELRQQQTLIAGNTVWGGTDALAAAFVRVGAFLLARTSLDSALRLALPAGGYTAKVSGSNDGVALAEFYLDDADANAPLQNLSVRGFSGVGESSIIAGFYVAGDGPQRLLIRGVGPGLIDFGVSGTMSDPRLTIYRGTVPIAENDTINAEALDAGDECGAFPVDAAEGNAGLVLHLESGGYTAIVTGDAGVALVEIYALPPL